MVRGGHPAGNSKILRLQMLKALYLDKELGGAWYTAQLLTLVIYIIQYT